MPTAPDMDKLERRVFELEGRVAILEDALGMTYVQPVGLGLTRFEAMIVGMLLKTSVASRERIHGALYADRDDPPQPRVIDVFITRTRNKLKPMGVEIRNTWGVGYWIPAEQKRLLAH